MDNNFESSFGAMVCLAFVFLFFSIIAAPTNGSLALIWFFCMIISLSVSIYFSRQSRRTEAAILAQQEEYEISRDEAAIPSRAKDITQYDESLADWRKCAIWIEDDALYLFPRDARRVGERYTLDMIPINEILYYKQFGYVTSEVTGSGGGSSYSPLTGFHGKVNPIEISTQIVDKRTTRLFCLWDDDPQDVDTLVFQHDDFEILKLLLPDKDSAIVEQMRIHELGQSPTAKDVKSRLRLLKEIHEGGDISDEEYQQMRAQLLQGIAE